LKFRPCMFLGVLAGKGKLFCHQTQDILFLRPLLLLALLVQPFLLFLFVDQRHIVLLVFLVFQLSDRVHEE